MVCRRKVKVFDPTIGQDGKYPKEENISEDEGDQDLARPSKPQGRQPKCKRNKDHEGERNIDTQSGERIDKLSFLFPG